MVLFAPVNNNNNKQNTNWRSTINFKAVSRLTINANLTLLEMKVAEWHSNHGLVCSSEQQQQQQTKHKLTVDD